MQMKHFFNQTYNTKELNQKKRVLEWLESR